MYTTDDSIDALIPFLKTDYMTTFPYRCENSGVVIQDRRVRHREVLHPNALARGRDRHRPAGMCRALQSRG